MSLKYLNQSQDSPLFSADKKYAWQVLRWAPTQAYFLTHNK